MPDVSKLPSQIKTFEFCCHHANFANFYEFKLKEQW